MAFVFVPVVQRELDDFRTIVWNNSRGRAQPGKLLPTGVPLHIYQFPEQYGPYSDHGIRFGSEEMDALNKIEDLQPIFAEDIDNFIPSTIKDSCSLY